MTSMALRTLVFMDLEGTHLPNRVPPFGPPRITEVALLACRMRQFKRPFRVTDRISFCIRPPENICSETTQITGTDSFRADSLGDLHFIFYNASFWNFMRKHIISLSYSFIVSAGLDNYNLEQQPVFSETATALKAFMLTLDQPICLIAHNGEKFDFPLLKAELDACGDTWDDLDIHICDSLQAFRFILPQHPEDHFSVAASECRLEEARLLQEDRSASTQSQQSPENICTPPKNPPSDKELNSPSEDEQPGMRTPPRSQQPPKPNHPPQAPHKKRIQSRFVGRRADGKIQPRKTSYKLADIYRRFV